MAYTGTSIVDYLKSVGQDSSYSARSSLASKYGISNYSGTAEQNTQLLSLLQKPTPSVAAPVTPTPTPTATQTTTPTVVNPIVSTFAPIVQPIIQPFASIMTPAVDEAALKAQKEAEAAAEKARIEAARVAALQAKAASLQASGAGTTAINEFLAGLSASDKALVSDKFGANAAPVAPQFTPAGGVGTVSGDYTYTSSGWKKTSELSAVGSSYTGTSIVDYLKLTGQASDFASRTTLAAKYGITNYVGSAEQNTALLTALKKGASSATVSGGTAQPTTPTISPVSTIPEKTTVETTANLPASTITPPTLPTTTATNTVQTNFDAISTDALNKKQALLDAYNAQITSIKADAAAAQAKIDDLTSKQAGVLGDINTATAPFRAALETAERTRLKIEENFTENQKLVDELDTLLSEGNALIKQQKEATGLSAIRDPRVNQTISDVNARAGVIEAVINARNNQITVAENLIDRTVAAITADRQDQLTYYSTLYNFYEGTKTTETAKLVTLTAAEKEYIAQKIDILETELTESEATAANIKAAMINPSTALIYASAGISLNDSVSTINTKLANYVYTKELSDTSNTMTTNDYQYLLPIQAAAMPASSYVTIKDSKGNMTYWKKPVTVSTEAAATVKVGDATYQWNPETQMFDIPVGAVAPGTGTADTLKIQAIDDSIALVNKIKADSGLSAAVNPNKITAAIEGLLNWGNMTGNVQSFIGDTESMLSTGTLNAFINAKAGGATFGALSDAELMLLGNSFSKIRQWQVREGNKPDGRVIGYNVDEASFKAELDNINLHSKRLKEALQGSSITTPTGNLPIIKSTVGDIDPNF